MQFYWSDRRIFEIWLISYEFEDKKKIKRDNCEMSEIIKTEINFNIENKREF